MKQILPNRLIRRVLLVIIALVLGYGLTAVIVTQILDTTIPEYAWGPEFPIPLPYFFLTGLFFALGFAVWLDKFLDTEVLPH